MWQRYFLWIRNRTRMKNLTDSPFHSRIRVHFAADTITEITIEKWPVSVVRLALPFAPRLVRPHHGACFLGRCDPQVGGDDYANRARSALFPVSGNVFPFNNVVGPMTVRPGRVDDGRPPGLRDRGGRVGPKEKKKARNDNTLPACVSSAGRAAAGKRDPGPEWT